MAYDFRSLLPADFEDLARDLIGRLLHRRFEAFTAGPDGGMDGRHATARGEIILQAKHYVGSTVATLVAAMKKERPAIDRLAAYRYILATSRSLTPANKTRLASEIGPSLRDTGDIFGAEDLNGLLRRYPAIERQHLKLWLSSKTVLETVLNAIVHAASYAFTATTAREIAAKVRVYAQNPSLVRARDILDQRHVLIISGPPGVGKTTLAEILTFAYLGEEWELVAIASLEDGFARIDDSRRQIFFFDDFLSAIALDHRALAAKDSALALFMARIRNSPNARFVLTTRAYILNEARGVSERLADKKVDMSTFVLDLSDYSRSIKARILYNHLIVGAVPREHLLALLNSDALPKIVDHDNYNPRVIEWMTDAMRLEEIAPSAYPRAFMDALDNPHKLWDNAFRNHISLACRNLLIALFFASRWRERITALRAYFDALHARICRDLGTPRDPKDFEESLRRLESGFVSITSGVVDFINPSLRDYLDAYLADGALLPHAAAGATDGAVAQAVWTFAKSHVDDRSRLAALAPHFLHLIDRFQSARPAWLVLRTGDHDLDFGARIELLLEWWVVTGDTRFSDAAIAISERSVGHFAAWRDGTKLIELVAKLASPNVVASPPQGLVGALEAVLIAMLGRGIGTDDLVEMSDRIEEGGIFSDGLRDAFNDAIRTAIDETASDCSSYTSESELDEQADRLRQLAPRAGVTSLTLQVALDRIETRIAEVREDRAEASEPKILSAATSRSDVFDDAALVDLFDSLR